MRRMGMDDEQKEMQTPRKGLNSGWRWSDAFRVRDARSYAIARGMVRHRCFFVCGALQRSPILHRRRMCMDREFAFFGFSV